MALRKNLLTQSHSMLFTRRSARMPALEARLTPYSLLRSPSAFIHTSSSPIRAPASSIRPRLMFSGVSKPRVGPSWRPDASDRHRLPFGPMYIHRRVPYLGSDPQSPVLPGPVDPPSTVPSEPVRWKGQTKTWRTVVADACDYANDANNLYESMFSPKALLFKAITYTGKLLRGIDSAPLLSKELPVEVTITDKTSDRFMVKVAYRFEVKVVQPVIKDVDYIPKAMEAAGVLVRVQVRLESPTALMDPKGKHGMLKWLLNLATEYLGICCENCSLEVLWWGRNELP